MSFDLGFLFLLRLGDRRARVAGLDFVQGHELHLHIRVLRVEDGDERLIQMPHGTDGSEPDGHPCRLRVRRRRRARSPRIAATEQDCDDQADGQRKQWSHAGLLSRRHDAAHVSASVINESDVRGAGQVRVWVGGTGEWFAGLAQTMLHGFPRRSRRLRRGVGKPS